MDSFIPDNIPPTDPLVYSTGATREKAKLPRYDLIPVTVLRRLGFRYLEGSEKYGDRNWEKGMSWQDTYNHTIEHLTKFRNGEEPTDDHLAGAMWGLAALMEYQTTHPELNDLIVTPNYPPPKITPSCPSPKITPEGRPRSIYNPGDLYNTGKSVK